MPRKSDEPEYLMHPLLAKMVAGWEAACPGIRRAVHEEIATGDWDKQEGGFVPGYSLEDSFTVAKETLVKQLIAVETARLHRSGPLLVRLGISKPAQVLTEKDRLVVEQAELESVSVLVSAKEEQKSTEEACAIAKPAWNLAQWGTTAPMKVSFVRE